MDVDESVSLGWVFSLLGIFENFRRCILILILNFFKKKKEKERHYYYIKINWLPHVNN